MYLRTTSSSVLVILLLWVIVFPVEYSVGLHLKGTWTTDDDDFFLFLTKFGFQKTEPRSKNDTQGYIFGNITSAKVVTWNVTRLRPTTKPPKRLVKRHSENSDDSKLAGDNHQVPSVTPKNTRAKPIQVPLSSSSTSAPGSSSSSTSSSIPIANLSTKQSQTLKAKDANRNSNPPLAPKNISPLHSNNERKPTGNKETVQVFPATLVVLDRGLFINFYHSRSHPDKDTVCHNMFKQIQQIAYDPYCHPEGTEHLIKRIPCPKGGLCPDEKPNGSYVVQNNQFTFAISDPSQPKYWYVSLVACYWDPSDCEWKYSGTPMSIDYDIWLVNGNPYTKNQNPLEYQFSFDRQDTVEIYLVFFMCFLVLFPLQIHAVLRQRHIVPRLFTISVSLELIAILANVVHVLKFSINGVGHPSLAVFGDIMDIAARALFMLILLVLAKGWAVTRTELTSKPFIFTIWTIYGVVHVLLYVWKETEVDVIEDIDEYQTWPGWLILVLRNVIMIWFLYELKDTMDHEHQTHKLNFFLHFGAASLVWFIYLPIIALIALQITPIWRSKFLLGITYSADCFAFAVMTHLLWPTRSQQYFLLAAKNIALTDELEEFNEAPHVVNSYTRRPNSRQFFSDSLVRNHFGGDTQEGSNNGSVNTYDDWKDNTPLIIS